MFRLGRRIGTEVPGPELKNPAAFGGSSPKISSPTAQRLFDGLHWRAKIKIKNNVLKNALGSNKKIDHKHFFFCGSLVFGLNLQYNILF
jgi:hypothetical protein